MGYAALKAQEAAFGRCQACFSSRANSSPALAQLPLNSTFAQSLTEYHDMSMVQLVSEGDTNILLAR